MQRQRSQKSDGDRWPQQCGEPRAPHVIHSGASSGTQTPLPKPGTTAKPGSGRQWHQSVTSVNRGAHLCLAVARAPPPHTSRSPGQRRASVAHGNTSKVSPARFGIVARSARSGLLPPPGLLPGDEGRRAGGESETASLRGLLDTLRRGRLALAARLQLQLTLAWRDMA